MYLNFLPEKAAPPYPNSCGRASNRWNVGAVTNLFKASAGPSEGQAVLIPPPVDQLQPSTPAWTAPLEPVISTTPGV